MARSAVATGERHLREVRGARVGRKSADQKFSAPGRAVVAVTHPVEAHPDDVAVESVLGHAACQVRVMMLDRDELYSGVCEALLGVARRGVVRV